MKGAEALARGIVSAGLRTCFVNPGTTELPMLAAIAKEPSIRQVLCLFEGVATGAADGYARISGEPACVLLHLGPGFANGIANLHNAHRARSPVLVLLGDHPDWHLQQDPPLAMSLLTLARSVSPWVRRSRSADAIGQDVGEAIRATLGEPRSVSTLIVPTDCQNGSCPETIARQASGPAPLAKAGGDRVARAAELLTGGSTALLLGGAALGREGLRGAADISRATGCSLLSVPFPARAELGRGFPELERIPYLRAFARPFFARWSRLVLAGAKAPAEYFSDGTREPFLPDGMETFALAGDSEDVAEALGRLASEVSRSAKPAAPSASRPERAATRDARFSERSIVELLAEEQVEGAIVVDEGISVGGAYMSLAASAPPHTYLSLTGGATGFGMSCAIGASIAAPDRKTVVITGDGSALYNPQALWTQARENLNVLNLVIVNNAYRILQFELEMIGASAKGMTDLSPPTIDWVALSRSLGVPAIRATDHSSLREGIRRGLSEAGPHLIEVQV